MRFNIGIRGHDLPNAPFLNVDDFINTFKQYDLDYLQLVISKAFKDFEFNKDNLTSLANKLKANDIKVAMIGAYFNMIHPDKVRQSKGTNYFKDCMKYAYLFDTKYVGKVIRQGNRLQTIAIIKGGTTDRSHSASNRDGFYFITLVERTLTYAGYRVSNGYRSNRTAVIIKR